jgi:hypothetical protein
MPKTLTTHAGLFQGNGITKQIIGISFHELGWEK